MFIDFNQRELMENLIKELEAFHFMLGNFIYRLKSEGEITGELKDHVAQIIFKYVHNNEIELKFLSEKKSSR